MKQKGFAPILIVILIATLVGGYLLYQNQTKTASIPQSQNPLITPQTPQITSVPSPTLDKNQANFVQGEITVGIKSGVKFLDAEQLIQSYNLKYKAPVKLDLKNKTEIPYSPEEIVGESPVFFTVFVPKGEENKWVGIFTSSQIVKYASLNYYSYLQNQ